MVSELRNTMIGVFLIVAIGAVVWLVLFLKPSVGDEKQIIYVRFSNINKINVGTLVIFAGRPVGEVTAVSQIYHARETQPADSLGRVYFYQLTLRIDSNIIVYNTDEISLQTSGLLGEKSVAIVPKAPPKGIIPERITDKTPFYADSIDAIENTFHRLSDIGQKLEETIDLINDWFCDNRDSLSHAVSSFSSTLDQIHDIAQSINDEKIVHEVKIGTEHFSSLTDKVNNAIAQMDKDRVFTNVGDVVSNMKSASSNVDKIMKEIADGEGTLGKIIQGDDLYLRLTAILSKADTTMNDINHYGLLFHLNKGWQRTRTKRMSLLDSLNTPTAFKDYFESEIDQINTAMSRISMLIAKAQAKPESEKILQTPRFKQDFAELLRQVDEMSDNLKLYNEQLTEKLEE